MKARGVVLVVTLSCSNTAVLANCKDFLVAGKEYLVEYTTTTGPEDVGRVQRQMITATRTSDESECRKVSGTFAGSWAMTLKGCNTLDVVASRSGDGNLTGQGTCSGENATGSFGYVDGRNQTWGYDFKMTRK